LIQYLYFGIGGSMNLLRLLISPIVSLPKAEFHAYTGQYFRLAVIKNTPYLMAENIKGNGKPASHMEEEFLGILMVMSSSGNSIMVKYREMEGYCVRTAKPILGNTEIAS